MKLQLSNVTLIAADTYNYGAAVSSLQKSMAQVDFGAVKFLTDIPIELEGIDVVQIPTMRSKEDYSKFIIKELYKHFDTDYVLVTQHDGWVLDASAWQDKFFDYDFLGAAWLYTDGRNVGNGGFSLRSKKLQTILGTDAAIEMYSPEDEVIGRLYRQYLEEKHWVKFPCDEICDEFSFELREPTQSTFGFHSNFHKPYQPTVIIKRKAAFGDVIRVEKVMRYFYDKGYRVVLDTLPNFHLAFVNHLFKVHSMGEVDGRLLKNAKVVNLDMSYESKPKQLHLKTYFEFAGVPYEEYEPYLKNQELSLGFQLNEATKMFKKYCIIHVDNREQASRNIYGVDWEIVVDKLKKLGYTPIQVGRDDTALIEGAIKINCTNENFLCYVVGGADLMIGIDSGISHIASGFNVPSILFFGSVNPEIIHADSKNKMYVHLHEKKICDKPFCWHSEVSTVGAKCYIDNDTPPCTQFNTKLVLDSINKIA